VAREEGRGVVSTFVDEILWLSFLSDGLKLLTQLLGIYLALKTRFHAGNGIVNLLNVLASHSEKNKWLLPHMRRGKKFWSAYSGSLTFYIKCKRLRGNAAGPTPIVVTEFTVHKHATKKIEQITESGGWGTWLSWHRNEEEM